jgi:hypothetical protein
LITEYVRSEVSQEFEDNLADFSPVLIKDKDLRRCQKRYQEEYSKENDSIKRSLSTFRRGTGYFEKTLNRP